MGGPEAVVRRARELHEAGVGILDVAVIGGTMRRAMDLYQSKFAAPLRDIG
jgi:hypothetical protein